MISRPTWSAVGSHDEFSFGLVAPGIVQQSPEVGVHVQQADHVRSPGHRDRGSHDVGLPAVVAFQT